MATEAMIVRCISTYPNAEQLEQLGSNFYRAQSFGLEIGKEYLVLGIDFHIDDHSRGTAAYVEYLDEANECPAGLILRAPICLFEIVDARPSKYWEVRQENAKTVALKPNSFYRQYYYDDLSESVPEVMDDFARVYALLASEYEHH